MYKKPAYSLWCNASMTAFAMLNDYQQKKMLRREYSKQVGRWEYPDDYWMFHRKGKERRRNYMRAQRKFLVIRG